jgi:peptidoglycan/LPS O-acetylase OafA/YrhL
VVLYHLGELDANASFKLGRIAESGFLGVDVFFVLSGFILSFIYCPRLPERFSPRWFKSFISRRIAKIYPLHLLTFLAMFAIIIVARHSGYNFTHKGSNNTTWTAICNVLMIHAWGLTSGLSYNFPSWSISAEWMAYLTLFAPAAFILRRLSLRLVLAFVLTLWVMFLAYLQFVHHGQISIMTVDGVVRIIPEFLSGYLLFRVLDGRFMIENGDHSTIIGLVLLLVVCFVPHANLFFILAIMPLLAGLYVGGPLSSMVFGNRYAVLIGEASFSIYMLQPFVMIAANQFTRHFHLVFTRSIALLVTLADVATVVILGCLCFRFFEEPVRELVVKALNRNVQSNPASELQVSATIG